MKTVDPRTLARWRAWLDKHHASATEIWLVFHKPHTAKPSVNYMDALDEALCYGWIDSLIKRIDDDKYARKFTPRKPDSNWSGTNRKRYAELAKAGRLARAGRERAPTDRRDARPHVPETFPPFIARRLKRSAPAWRFFQTLTRTEQRRYMMWIYMAKQAATRERRMREAVALLSKKKTLGLR